MSNKKVNIEKKTELIVELYKHEDSLLWIKIRFMLLLNSGLLVGWKFLAIDTRNVNGTTGLLFILFGFICNLIFALSLHGSKRHITAYREAWSSQLFRTSGSKFAGNSPLGLSTTNVTIFLAILVALLWLVAFVIMIFGVSVIHLTIH